MCEINIDERRHRIQTRSRHPAHATADQQQLRDLDVTVDYSLLLGRTITVNTRHAPAFSARIALEQLDEAKADGSSS